MLINFHSGTYTHTHTMPTLGPHQICRSKAEIKHMSFNYDYDSCSFSKQNMKQSKAMTATMATVVENSNREQFAHTNFIQNTM